MKKVVVFTGAGMSVPLGLPSTMDFMESVDKGAKPIIKHVSNYLGSSAEDIEWMLSTLESFNNETPFTEFLLPHITKSAANHQVLLKLQQQLSSLKSQAVSEVTRIKKIIFDKLNQYESDQAVSLYFNLINEIRESFGEVSISLITTNYDLTFESAIESSQSMLKKAGINDVDFGFSIKFGRPIYSPSQDFEWDPNKLEYLKIHGSVDWHRDSKGKCSRSMSSTVPDDPDQMAILYPGFKGVPDVEPFISMHGRLNRRLAEADHIIVIGFAFRDAYINNIFENILRMRPDTELLYFNPLSIDEYPEDSMVPHLVKNYSSFKHVEKGIGIESGSLNLKEEVSS